MILTLDINIQTYLLTTDEFLCPVMLLTSKHAYKKTK